MNLWLCLRYGYEYELYFNFLCVTSEMANKMKLPTYVKNFSWVEGLHGKVTCGTFE